MVVRASRLTKSAGLKTKRKHTQVKSQTRWPWSCRIGTDMSGVSCPPSLLTTVSIVTPVFLLQIRFQPNDHKTIKETADELKIFEGIKHPNLVRYFGVELHRVSRLQLHCVGSQWAPAQSCLGPRSSHCRDSNCLIVRKPPCLHHFCLLSEVRGTHSEIKSQTVIISPMARALTVILAGRHSSRVPFLSLCQLSKLLDLKLLSV